MTDTVGLENREKQISILLKTSKAIAEAGTPAHLLENYMAILLERFELTGCFFAMPTAILASLGLDFESERSYMVKIKMGEINLSTLQRINTVFNKLNNDEIAIDKALQQIRYISENPYRYPQWLTVFSFGLVSGGFTALLSGSWHDVVAAFFLGTVSGAIISSGKNNQHVAQLSTPLTAMIIGFLAFFIGAKTQSVDYFLVSLAGLIFLVPGLGITIAIRELSTGHLVSGSSRMAGAITTLFLLSFGLALGFLLAQNIYEDIDYHKQESLPQWAVYSIMVVSAFGFSVLFKSQIRYTFWVLLSLTLAFFGSQISGLWVEQPFQSMVAAMLVSCMGNIYSRMSHNPASLIHIPGVILLVPGSMGFHSLSAMHVHDTVSGIQVAFQAALVAIGISIGLLVGNLLVPAKRNL